jgi:hypothetical protein
VVVAARLVRRWKIWSVLGEDGCQCVEFYEKNDGLTLVHLWPRGSNPVSRVRKVSEIKVGVAAWLARSARILSGRGDDNASDRWERLELYQDKKREARTYV